MVAGLLADLTAEHRKCVASTDYDDADITEVAIHTYRFEERCRVLFTDGLIMAESMSTTFTSEVIKFYRNPSALLVGKTAMLLALPNTRAEQYEPLDRIRAIIPGVMASLKAALPSSAWQRTFFVLASANAFWVRVQGQERNV